MSSINAYLPSKVHQNAMNNVRVAVAKNIRNEKVNATFISIFTGIYGCMGRATVLGTCFLGNVVKVAIFSIRLISKDFLTERFDKLPGWEALRQACVKTIQQAAAVFVSVFCTLGEVTTFGNAPWAQCNYNMQLKWGLIQDENPITKHFEQEKKFYEKDLALRVNQDSQTSDGHDSISLDTSDDEFDTDNEQDDDSKKIQVTGGPNKDNGAADPESETLYTTAGASY